MYLTEGNLFMDVIFFISYEKGGTFSKAL